MTADELVSALVRCRKRNAELRAHNHKLWESSQEWKRKHAERRHELNVLRDRVRRLDSARLRWKAQAPPVHKRKAPRNVFLSEQDLARILRMRVRD